MLLTGDVIEQLRTLPDCCVDMCVTSPPYYGLRDYGTGEGQIGLEDTPEQYIDKLVAVFHEVKRTLSDDGVLWVNVGDSYSGSGKGPKGKISRDCQDMDKIGKGGKVPPGTKPKDLIGIPWMLAFALRADGWYLRQDVIWAKNNPMPESVKDRCTRSHEYIFMLTKSRKYYFDHEAIQEPVANPDRKNYTCGSGKLSVNAARNDNDTGVRSKDLHFETRNKRDVWNVSVCSTVKEAHFAVFPKELIEPCILSSCPVGGTVLDPFSGSGTSGIVAMNNGRNYIGIDLNPEYHEIAKRRFDKECTNASTVCREL